MTNMPASHKRRPGVVMRFLAQMNRPMSLGRLWVILFTLHVIANILGIILRGIVVALR
jgi:hypothetical protein